MLQQTTVMTVENKLKSYLKEFPDFRSYKNKDLSDVLNSWSGLGYYKRAENLFRSVEIINEKYDAFQDKSEKISPEYGENQTTPCPVDKSHNRIFLDNGRNEEKE